MRKLVLFTLIFISTRSYGQILEMPLSSKPLKRDVPFPPPINKDGTFKFDKQLTEKESRIAAWPSQKVTFTIEVNTPGHQIIICDTLGRVLYSQRKQKGYYSFETFTSYRYIVIYEIDKSENRNFVGYNPIDEFHRDIIFGDGKKIDGAVRIVAKRRDH
jgi:hypothetical protein